MSDTRPDESQRVPQVSSRARVYKLSDDGASDLALTKRYHRDNRANLKALAEHLEQQLESGKFSHRSTREQVQARLENVKRSIERSKESPDSFGPTPTIVAPITRRVRREDKKRRKASRK